jgi:hypothetical protein
MRDPRHAFRPFIVKETQAAREKLAAAHFALEAVREKISAAAMRGEGALRLPLGQLTAELRETKPARELAAWCERNGLSLEWAERVLERPDGFKLRTAEAIISWVPEASTS